MLQSIDISLNDKLGVEDVLNETKKAMTELRKQHESKGIYISFKTAKVVEKKPDEGLIIMRLYYTSLVVNQN